jgi:putative sigma-54 modulation protein
MKLNVVGRQMNVFEDTKEHIAKKIAKLDKFFPQEGDATVVLSRRHGASRIELTINAGGTIFRAEQDAGDFREALDRAVEVIERQIRKNKTRLAKRLRETIPDEGFFAAEDEDPETIVRTKEIPLKPMSVEEAILQMNLLGHSFFVFRDDADAAHRICVVYARRDGDYGLLVPHE